MTSSVFNTDSPVAGQSKQHMFLSGGVAVARYDVFTHKVFEDLTDKQYSFFWRPQEVDVTKDRIDFTTKLTEQERFIFINNLKYQILLDSVQGRAPNQAFARISSISEMETWVETWSFFETIHSRSYTHIIQNLFTDPTEVFDTIVSDEEIKKRATDISHYYDDLIAAIDQYNRYGDKKVTCNRKSTSISLRDIKKKLFLCMNSVNALEAIRFYVSFACTFSFAERELMEGNAKIMRLIARDENLHLTSTQHILNLWRKGKDDPEMVEIARECEAEARQIFMDAVNQEKQWAKYLFSKGSMIGMNADMLCLYVEYIANLRMSALGYEKPFEVSSNPLPWMNNHLSSDHVQVAPQESEISSYLVGQIDSAVPTDEFKDMVL